MKYKDGDRVVILDVSKNDAYFHRKEDFIGKVGVVEGEVYAVKGKKKGFVGCNIRVDGVDDFGTYFFLEVKLRKAKEGETKPELNAETARNGEEECDVLSKPSVSY